MFARALPRARSYGEPIIPRLLIPDPGPVALDIADQLGQRVVNGLLPRPHRLERPQDGPDAVGKERLELLLHPGLGPRRIVGRKKMGEGREMVAEMGVVCWASKLILAWSISRTTCRICVKMASEALAT